MNKPVPKSTTQEVQTMLTDSADAVKGVVEGIGGAFNYYAGSLWGSSVQAEPEPIKIDPL
tara:strand:+ start:411 stop:590 length:180 start_codon:yes stop_codon:yes gene_type:complete